MKAYDFSFKMMIRDDFNTIRYAQDGVQSLINLVSEAYFDIMFYG